MTVLSGTPRVKQVGFFFLSQMKGNPGQKTGPSLICCFWLQIQEPLSHQMRGKVGTIISSNEVQGLCLSNVTEGHTSLLWLVSCSGCRTAIALHADTQHPKEENPPPFSLQLSTKSGRLPECLLCQLLPLLPPAQNSLPSPTSSPCKSKGITRRSFRLSLGTVGLP